MITGTKSFVSSYINILVLENDTYQLISVGFDTFFAKIVKTMHLRPFRISYSWLHDINIESLLSMFNSSPYKSCDSYSVAVGPQR